jgi:hypothetical protein
MVNHYRVETSDWYPKKATLIGSHGLDLPPDETDDYLRVYELREPIGDWGSRIVERFYPGHGAFLYRGMIFEHMRYDFLITITATVMRSSVFAILGLPEPRWFTGSDFHFMARLCKTWRANFLSVPSAIKHEYADDGALPKSGHVVTGNSALRFATEWQRAWEDLFWTTRNMDPELRGLRSLRLFWMAQVALNSGERELTLQYLEEAREGLAQFWRAIALYWLVRCLPGVKPAQTICWALSRIRYRVRTPWRSQ